MEILESIAGEVARRSNLVQPWKNGKGEINLKPPSKSQRSERKKSAVSKISYLGGGSIR